MKRKYILAAILVVVLIGALATLHRGHQTPAGQAPLENLTARNVSDMKRAFNAAKDEVRVLVLLSPT